MCHHLDSPHNPVHAHECVCYASLVHMSLPTVFHQEKWLPFDLWDYERTCCWLVIFLWERWVLVKSLLGKLTGRLTKYCNGFFFLIQRQWVGRRVKMRQTHTHTVSFLLFHMKIFSFITKCHSSPSAPTKCFHTLTGNCTGDDFQMFGCFILIKSCFTETRV